MALLLALVPLLVCYFLLVCLAAIDVIPGLHRAGLDVGIVEVEGEEEEVTKIHEKRIMKVVIGLLTIPALCLQMVCPQVDHCSHHHLS